MSLTDRVRVIRRDFTSCYIWRERLLSRVRRKNPPGHRRKDTVGWEAYGGHDYGERETTTHALNPRARVPRPIPGLR